MLLIFKYKILLGLSCFILLDACTTGNVFNSSNEKPISNGLVIELKESFTGNYLTKNYSSFDLKEIKRSNRTLNQYIASYYGSKEDLSKLIDLFHKDKNVLKVELQNQSLDDPHNSTNNKKAKTSPKTKN